MTSFSTYLFPGYSKEYFALGRYELNRVALEPEPKGTLASTAICTLSKLTEYVEIPFVLIEMVALNTINTLGAVFSSGCRQNLSSSIKIFIYEDLISTVIKTLAHFILFQFGALLHGLFMSFEYEARLNVPQHLKAYQRSLAIRIHGYNKISYLESLFDLKGKRPQLNYIIMTSLSKEELAEETEKIKHDQPTLHLNYTQIT